MNGLADGQPIQNDTHEAQVDDNVSAPGPDAPDSTPSRIPDTDTISTNATNGAPEDYMQEVEPSGSGTGAVDEVSGGVAGEQVQVKEEEETEIGPQPALSEDIKEEGEMALDQMPESQMDLAETMMDTNGVGSDDGGDWIADGDHELKRVKVYELVGTRWVDKGTAFCFGQFSEESNEALLIARSEKNYSEVILSTTIRSNDVYQRQQETLIVWTEPDGVDYALSFQDPEGCSEVWSFILEVQRHMSNADNMSAITSSPLIGPDVSVTTASIYRSGHLPQPRLGIIGEIERAIKALARTALMKERICEYIQHEDYIKSLIEVMNAAEDLESLENLHALCSLMQTILMLNDHTMFEHVLDDDLFFGVVGMLEYDPDFPDHKANYREFLQQQSRFHQPIPIRDITIQRKIHHTYRLQFLKDVVLARALDDTTFNVLNSCIIFNQIDIIQHVQQDAEFLRDIVSLYVDEGMLSNPLKKANPPCPGPQQQNLPPNQIIISLNGHDDDMDVDPKPETQRVITTAAYRQYYQTHYAWAPPNNLSEEELNLRRETIILVQQLCVMGKNVQLPARMALFRTLVDRGILFAVHWALALPEREEANKSMISAAGEVLTTLLDHDLNGVRNHCMRHVDAIMVERAGGKKDADKAESLLETLCRMMATSRDLAIQSQVGDALRTWLEVPPANEAQPGGEAGGPARQLMRKDGDVAVRFTTYFYKGCVQTLFKPLLELTEWQDVPVLPLFREEASRFTYLADLLHLFTAQHGADIFNFSVSTRILSHVASLLKAKDKHLRHAAFRIFRLLLKQNNPTMRKRLISLDVFKPILDLTLQESRRDNLLSCSCHEFFDTMRRENHKDLIEHVMLSHEEEIRKLAKTPLGSQRFELFIKRYEINCEPGPSATAAPPPTEDPKRPGTSLGNIDAEEESYFNGDDEEEDESNVVSIEPSWQKQRPSTLLSSVPISNLKRKRRPGITGTPTKGGRGQQQSQTTPPRSSTPLGSLLDYGDDDDEESQEESQSPKEVAIPPTPQLSAASLPLKPPPKDDDSDDELESSYLESLASKARSQSPAPSGPKDNGSSPPRTSPSLTPMRLPEKRRRGENDDDDDQLLERLRKSKKVDQGAASKEAPLNRGHTSPSSKAGDDPPKKMIKVKLSSTSLSLGSAAAAAKPSKPDSVVTPAAPPVPSSTLPSPPGSSPDSSTKDGDTG
ncbi:nuclear protein [Coprinopsis sp. MPI-PUGE-AT-0042]|nr:nuclear protein [Coprinopsis sp. MPI-PUGE-AT-0042]